MQDVIKTEFARVNIYFRTLNLQIIEEQAKYDVREGCSNIYNIEISKIY